VKLIAFASAFSLAFSGLATAADLPTMKPAPAPPPYAFSWNSFYIGGFAGGAWTSDATTSDPCLVGAACAVTGTYNGVPPLSYNLGRSFTGGAEIGYNWQAMPNLLLGVEDKLGYMNLNGSRVMNGAVTLSRKERDRLAPRAISSGRNCLAPGVHRRGAEGAMRLGRCEVALDVEIVVDGGVG
jgi:opacity protein-like surface antigen